MTAAHETDDDRVRRQVGRVVDGIRARDIEALRRLYTTDVVSFDLEPPLRHVGVAAKLANWTRAFAAHAELDFEVRDLTVAVGGDLANGYCFGRLHGTRRDGTTTSGTWVRATYCFRRIGADWLVEHDHVSVPLDLGSGRGVVDLEP
jgi:ketosteroid isomerase-like protein